MFDFSFGEIGLIVIVALVVLGPERLPKVARTAGFLARKARTSWQNVRQEIERELQTEELKRSLDEARRAAADVRSDLQNSAAQIHSPSSYLSTETVGSSAPVKNGDGDITATADAARDKRIESQ